MDSTSSQDYVAIRNEAMSKSMDKKGHDEQKMRMNDHLSMLWPHFVNLLLGLWLITGPFVFGYLSAQSPDPGIIRVAIEGGLLSFETRNLYMTWSDVISGALIIVFSLLSLSPKRRLSWAQWANSSALGR